MFMTIALLLAQPATTPAPTNSGQAEMVMTPLTFARQIARVEFASNGAVSGCSTQTEGQTPEILPLCEMFGDRMLIDAFFAPVDATTKGYVVRLSLGKTGDVSFNQPVQSNGAKAKLALRFSFDVDKNGVGQNCEVTYTGLIEEFGEICEAMFDSSPQFTVDGEKNFPVSMTFQIDGTPQ